MKKYYSLMLVLVSMNVFGQSVVVLRLPGQTDQVRFESRNEEFTYTLDSRRNVSMFIVELPANDYLVYKEPGGFGGAQVTNGSGEKVFRFEDKTLYLFDASGPFPGVDPVVFGTFNDVSAVEDVNFLKSSANDTMLFEEVVSPTKATTDNAVAFAGMGNMIQPFAPDEYYVAKSGYPAPSFVTDDWDEPIKFDMTTPNRLYTVGNSGLRTEEVAWIQPE